MVFGPVAKELRCGIHIWNVISDFAICMDRINGLEIFQTNRHNKKLAIYWQMFSVNLFFYFDLLLYMQIQLWNQRIQTPMG